jgi:hypothetical protein
MAPGMLGIALEAHTSPFEIRLHIYTHVCIRNVALGFLFIGGVVLEYARKFVEYHIVNSIHAVIKGVL